MKFYFNTREYERSHGRQPKGRGSWAFRVYGEQQIYFSPSMTLADARKWVKAKILQEHDAALKEGGVNEVEVLVLP